MPEYELVAFWPVSAAGVVHGPHEVTQPVGVAAEVLHLDDVCPIFVEIIPVRNDSHAHIGNIPDKTKGANVIDRESNRSVRWIKEGVTDEQKKN